MRAADILAQALVLAAPEGYVRTFVNEGLPMAELLSRVLEAQQRRRPDLPVPAHYLRRLLAAIERDASDTAPPDTGLPNP